MWSIPRVLVVFAAGFLSGVAAGDDQSLSPLHPGPAEGFLALHFDGPWRGRIALNAPLFNEIDIEIDSGTGKDDVNLGLGWLLTNLEYIFPVDFEVRKGSFGAFVHTLFVDLSGAVEFLVCP